MTPSDYQRLCEQYAALPLIETPEQRQHADDLLRQIERFGSASVVPENPPDTTAA